MKTIKRQNRLDEERYRSQMQAIREEAKELGVVVFLPDYHRTKGDKNTVLLYFPEDYDFNKKMDTKGIWSEEAGCRPYFWSLENTDCNGRYDQKFANRGKLDLQSSDWADILRADIRLTYWKKKQFRYVLKNGGFGNILEADDSYNEMNTKIIQAMKDRYGKVYLGNINALKAEDAIVEYTGQPLYTGCCNFAVPVLDPELVDLVNTWRKDQKYECIKKITNRTRIINGENILWY